MKKIFTLFAALAMVMSMSAKTIYLKPNSNWTKDGAWFAAYLCNGSEAASWHKMDVCPEDGAYYQVDIDDAKLDENKNKNIIFCRMNPAKSDLGWGSCWNQSGDLDIKKLASNNCCAINSGEWNCGNKVTWSTFTPVVVEYTYTIAGASDVLGSHWDVADAKNDMIKQNDGTYALTKENVRLTKETAYEYKVVREHSWDWSYPSGNASFKVNKSGTYNVTFTFDGKTDLKVNPVLIKEEVVIPEVHIAGKLLNNWSSTANKLVLSKDSLTASAEIALKEGTDSIKMVVGGNWLGNNGTMTRENDGQAWTFTTEEGNCAIVADIAGNYVFTWNFEKNQLTVTYPELPTYNVTATVNPAKTGSVEGAKTYKHGEQATLTATPAEGYEFVNWTKGEEEVSTENPYTFTVTVDVALVANFKEAEPEYNVVEDEITNLMIDTESMCIIGGPSAQFGVDVFLVLTEQNLDGTWALSDESSVAIQGVDATFIDGYAYDIDVDAPAVKVVLHVEFGGTKYELQIDMTSKPVVIEIADAIVSKEEYPNGMGGTYTNWTMDGQWSDSDTTYPVLVDMPAFDPTIVEADMMVTIQIGSWLDVFYGAAEGLVHVTVAENVVTLTGTLTSYTAGTWEVTISGTLPVVEEPETPDPENPDPENPDTPTSVDNVEATVAPVKMIENGQLIIVKDGVQYNAQGAILK